MLKLEAFSGIYLHREAVDFRKSINGLCAVVEGEMKQSFTTGSLFVFISRRRDKLKILYFDRTGFALWYKRLEREKFQWPKKLEESVVNIDSQKLMMLLEGIDVWKMRPHETLRIEKTY
jgi:transposase